jgi:AcrR family transcriptional regulator
VTSTTSGSAPRRRYDNSRRRADAEARQQRIVEAAATLFVEQGFGATSIDQIATAANVSSPTVYATFGSKAGVLARAIDVAAVGDHEEVPLIDRVLSVIEECGPGRSATIRHGRTLHPHAQRAGGALEGTCSTDPVRESGPRSRHLRRDGS